jgi:hypothetical protein
MLCKLAFWLILLYECKKKQALTETMLGLNGIAEEGTWNLVIYAINESALGLAYLSDTGH